MLPRTGSTVIGDFGSSPGIVPAPASAPFSVCAEAGVATSAMTAATASTNPMNPMNPMNLMNLLNPLNPLNPRNPASSRIARSRTRGRRSGRRRHRLQLLAVLGVHRLGTAAARVVRDSVVRAELVQVRVRPRQQVGDHAARTIDFGNHPA